MPNRILIIISYIYCGLFICEIEGVNAQNINTSDTTMENLNLKIILDTATLHRFSLVCSDTNTMDSAKSGLLHRYGRSFSNLFLHVNSVGRINGGYDYGVIPMISNQEIVSGYFKTEGDVCVTFGALPINVRYYYSTLKSVSGLNNYFNFSFDINKYKENITKGISEKGRLATQELDSLNLIKQKLVQRKAYLEKDLTYKVNSYSSKINRDAIATGYFEHKLDSIKKIDVPKIGDLGDSINVPKAKDLNIKNPVGAISVKDSIEIENIIKLKKDSITEGIKDCENRIENYEKQIKECEELIAKTQNSIKDIQSITNPNLGEIRSNQYLSKFKSRLFDVKKLEIGLCYPNYSNFLIKGATIKGVNFEYESSDYFFAVTHGTTVNTFFNTTNIIQNNENQFKQMFDFLDFNELNKSRRITAVKFGFGKIQESHIHAGLLYGIGCSNLWDVGNAVGNNSIDRNYVVELDGRFVINKNNMLDFAYGKSSIQGENEILSKSERGFAGVFLPLRSNAVLTSFHSTIPKTNTKVALTFRWLDPFFKSYGIGFMKSDNMRYEAKIDQKVSNRISFGLMYRKTQDNLLSLYDYNNILNTAGISTKLKFSKSINLKLSYNSIFQTVKFKGENCFNTNSYITTGILSYSPSKLKTTFTFIYNNYNISDSSKINKFENFVFTGVSQMGKKLNNCFSINVLSSNLTDSLNENSTSFTEELVYQSKRKASVALNIKYAILSRSNNQVGYGIKVNFPIYKRISIDADFEKIVYGNFYNYYNVEQIKKFPYFCSVKLNYTW